MCSLYPQQKHAYSALHPQAWTYIYSSMPVGTYRVQSLGFPKIVFSVMNFVAGSCRNCTDVADRLMGLGVMTVKHSTDITTSSCTICLKMVACEI